MPVEIQMLVCSVALLFLIILIQAVAGALQVGPMVAAGNRDNMAALTGFAARAKRTVDNHREGLMLFAPIALAVVLIQQTDQWSALGAQIFLYARIGHAVCYLVGIPLIRPLFWLAGIVGTGMVFYALYT